MTESKSELEVNNDSAIELKKSIGKAVMQINSDMLALQQVYRKVKPSADKELNKKDCALETKVKNLYNGLKETVAKLNSKPDYVKSEGFDKMIKLMTTTLETADMLFDSNDGYEQVSEDILKETQELAKSSMSDLKKEEEKVKRTFDDLSKTLSTLVVDPDAAFSAESELSYLPPYKQDRYRRIEKALKKHMDDHLKKLNKVWDEEKESLDYIGLKEIRFEFDQADKQIRHTINEWEKRKYSDVLADHLIDMHDQLFQVYHKKYAEMADAKRQEAAEHRKKEKQLQDYKNEKKHIYERSLDFLLLIQYYA